MGSLNAYTELKKKKKVTNFIISGEQWLPYVCILEYKHAALATAVLVENVVVQSNQLNPHHAQKLCLAQ